MRQILPLADMVYAEQSATNGGNYLGVAANSPAAAGGRKARNYKRFAERSDDLCRADFLVLDHLSLIAPCLLP